MPDVTEICAMARPEICALQPYQADCLVCGIKLDANENGWDVPAEVKEEVFAKLKELPFNRYPDATWAVLRKALAERHSVDDQQIVIGNGSSELILTLMQTFAGNGIRVVYPSPSFSMYPIYAAIAGATGVKVPLDAQFQLDPDAMIVESKKPNTGLVVLCTPNNPTGNVMELSDIEKIVANSPCVVAIDEAYFEFHGETALSLVAKYPNAIVLRTFSKAYGLAGARVGYLIGQIPVVKQVAKVVLPYNINALSLTLAEVAMSRLELFEPRIQTIIAERERVAAALREIPGIGVYPSRANFLLMKCVMPTDAITQQLQQAGIGVKDFGKNIPQCIRVSIGTPEENDSFLQALRSIMTGVI
jgi:histidinol-phosphate aminotransferase